MIDLLLQFEMIECSNCRIQFAVTLEHEKHLRDSHEYFYCPNGHQLHYTGKTEEQRLKEQINFERKDHLRERETQQRIKNDLRNSLRAQKGVSTRRKNQLDKVKKGVCPCCDRFFENLYRHMETKHPKELADNEQ